MFSGADLVPLLGAATRLQLGGGVERHDERRPYFYANTDFQFAVGDTDGGQHNGVRGAAGVRCTW